MKALSPLPNSSVPSTKDARLAEAARTVLLELFNCSEIIKIGWDFGISDLDVLNSSFRRFFAPCFENIKGLLDIKTLIQSWQRDKSLPKSASLSASCQLLLSKKLNKQQQVLNAQVCE